MSAVACTSVGSIANVVELEADLAEMIDAHGPTRPYGLHETKVVDRLEGKLERERAALDADAAAGWPSMALLTATYGAPGNWPVEPRDAEPVRSEALALAV